MKPDRIAGACSTCEHWKRGEGCPPSPDGEVIELHLEEYGLCTLYPPQISSVLVKEKNNRWFGTPEFFQPSTTESEFCGQWLDDERGDDEEEE